MAYQGESPWHKLGVTLPEGIGVADAIRRASLDYTVSLAPFGSIYVELYQPEVGTATVHMKVDLDNGEGYEQNATLSDRAKLIYYFVFTSFTT